MYPWSFLYFRDLQFTNLETALRSPPWGPAPNGSGWAQYRGLHQGARRAKKQGMNWLPQCRCVALDINRNRRGRGGANWRRTGAPGEVDTSAIGTKRGGGPVEYNVIGRLWNTADRKRRLVGESARAWKWQWIFHMKTLNNQQQPLHAYKQILIPFITLLHTYTHTLALIIIHNLSLNFYYIYPLLLHVLFLIFKHSLPNIQ